MNANHHAVTPFIIESDSSIYQTFRASPGEEKLEVERTLKRPPFSDAWFETGDGKFNPSRLELTVRVSAGNLRASVAEMNHLMNVAESAKRIRWGEYRREVFGLSGPLTRVPIVLGYKVTLNFAPKSRYWLDELDQEVLL